MPVRYQRQHTNKTQTSTNEVKIRLCIISFHCLNCAKKNWTVNRTYPQTSYQSVFVLMLSSSHACFIFILLEFNRGLYLPFVFSYSCNNQCIVCLLLNIVILLTTMSCNCMNLVDHVLCHVIVLIWILFERKRFCFLFFLVLIMDHIINLQHCYNFLWT